MRDRPMRERALRWLDGELRRAGTVLGEAPGELQGSPPVSPPGGSWLRSIRIALGMTRDQLAARVGVSAPAVRCAERAESAGSISLATLRRYAAGLDCDLACVLQPRGPSLRAVLQDRAEALYRQRFGHRAIHAHEIRLLRHWVLSRNLSWLWDGVARMPDYGDAVAGTAGAAPLMPRSTRQIR